VTALKRWLRVDDPCDVFGVHGVCGIVGCIMTGIFAAKSLGGVGYAEGVTMVHQVLVQLESIAITVVWSGVVAFHRLQAGGYDRGSARTGRAGARRSGRQQPRRECV
jgi:ammonia channel protein AmtB